MKIVVAGIGYVGISNAVLLAQHHCVYAIDIDPKRVKLVNEGVAPIVDVLLDDYLKNRSLDIKATTDELEAYSDADFVIVATPTNYNEKENCFDTSSIEHVIERVVAISPEACIVIRSTLPIGYTASISAKYNHSRMLFVPEFLREGKALHDNLYPSRIVIGLSTEESVVRECADRFIQCLLQCINAADVPTLITSATEAEAIKLFSNAYLAMRVAFFNELDTFTESQGMRASKVIEGICLDPRIGAHYNNPSFGYGGYCLPKDTKQLLSSFGSIPTDIIKATVKANDTRKRYIAEKICAAVEEIGKVSCVIGIYRLTMKTDSDNIRNSAIIDVIEHLTRLSMSIIVYEPMIEEGMHMHMFVTHSLNTFKEQSDLIIANRYTSELADVRQKMYTRDLYCRD